MPAYGMGLGCGRSLPRISNAKLRGSLFVRAVLFISGGDGGRDMARQDETGRMLLAAMRCPTMLCGALAWPAVLCPGQYTAMPPPNVAC